MENTPVVAFSREFMVVLNTMCKGQMTTEPKGKVSAKTRAGAITKAKEKFGKVNTSKNRMKWYSVEDC